MIRHFTNLHSTSRVYDIVFRLNKQVQLGVLYMQFNSTCLLHAETTAYYTNFKITFHSQNSLTKLSMIYPFKKQLSSYNSHFNSEVKVCLNNHTF